MITIIIFSKTKKLMQPWIVVATLLPLFTISCATIAKGPSYSESKAVKSKPGSAILYVYRENAAPTAYGADILLNSKPLTTLNQNGFTWVYVKAGKNEIKTVWPKISGQNTDTVSLEIVGGRIYYLELRGVVSLIRGVYSHLTEVPPEFAEKKLETCCKFQKPPTID